MDVLVVISEKEVEQMEEVMNVVKRSFPMRFMIAYKAVDGVSKLTKMQQQYGKCDAALLSHKFTAPGKEEYSETLRKVLKDKNPDIPVVCFGKVKAGGKQGEHYHYGMDAEDGADPKQIIAVLKQIQAGEIKAEYGGKDKRKSLDGARTGSFSRTGSMERTKSNVSTSAAAAEVGRAAAAADAAGAGSPRPVRRSLDEPPEEYAPPPAAPPWSGA